MMNHPKHPSLLVALALATLTVESAPASTLAAWGRSWNGQGEVPGWVQNPVAIAAGRNHNLFIQADGTVAGWGENSYGEASPPPEAQGRTVAVAAGHSFSLALLTDGSVLSWGALHVTPAGASNLVAVAAGCSHGLALRQDGRVLAWGDNTSGQTESGWITDAVAVAGMAQSSLALRRDGTVAAWGNNVLGQTDVPPGLSNVVAVAGGSMHALALRHDGTVVAWGHNNSGQTAVPAGLSGVAAIAAGGSYSLALRSNGTVVAWGGGGEGVTNVPSGLTNGLAIAGGEGHALVLRGPLAPVFTRPRLAQVATLGSSLTLEAPALGTSPLHYSWYFQGTNLPNGNLPSLSLAQLQFADAGTYVVIASNSLGSVMGFLPLSIVSLQLREQPASQAAFPGDHVTFRVGIESGAPLAYQWRHGGTNLPHATNATLNLFNVSANQAGSYTVLASNSMDWVLSAKAVLSFPPLAAWGGDEWTPIANWPAGLGNVVTVAAGWGHAVALTPDGSVRAWGRNDTGQTNVPASLGPVVAVAAGGAFTLALRADGTVAGWGDNEAGQLNIPAGLHGVAALACGSSHAVALRTNGTVIAWGENQDGQADVPLGLDNIVAVAAGERHTLALRADGRVVGWGAGTDGQLDVPGDLTNAVAIASGGNHALALRADGTLSGWGTYFNGSDLVPMEPPAGLSNVLSIAAGYAHGLARLPRAVVGFGDHTYAQTNVPAHAAVSGAIAAGGHYGFALPAAGAPFLTTRLTDRSQRPGGTVHFRVEGNGARRMNFQWHRNGTPLPGQTNGVLTLTQLTPADAGAYSVTASNALGSVTLPPARLTVAPPPLEAALGTNQFPGITLGGDAAWFAQSALTHDGASAAQSGPITHLQETWMETTVTGPGLLSFWWKVSSEAGYDFLEFHLDGPGSTPSLALSGETDWVMETVALSGGEHTLRWRYHKDVWDDAGLDAGWVDEVTLTPTSETDATLRFLSMTPEGVITWSSTRTNIYVGFQYVERLGECFQDVPDDSFWNILQTNYTQSATLPAEAAPPFFLRLIGSAAPLTRSTFDVDALGLPRFVTNDWVDLAKIGALSRFRSAAGGDYSDDFESCRSMQHQFEPLAGVQPATITVFAPVTGRVCAISPDGSGATTVVIESQQRPAFAFHLGSIRPTNTLSCGQWVVAGAPLGTLAGGGWTSSISVWVRTPTGRKLVSYFDVMADSVFQSYQWRGVAAREALIISRAARDSDPLTCAGFEFEGPGNLPNYHNLQ